MSPVALKLIFYIYKREEKKIAALLYPSVRSLNKVSCSSFNTLHTISFIFKVIGLDLKTVSTLLGLPY